MTREVITLQLGNFANHVGAHYWNIQDELLGLQEQQGAQGPAAQIDSNVLYRQGETLHGEGTYTPRLVLWDLSGALGGVSAGGSLYRDSGHGSDVVSSWGGRQEVHRAAAVPKSAFAAELEQEAERQEAEGGQAQGELSALEVAAQQLEGGSSGSGGTSGSSGGGVRYFTDYLKAHLHPRSVQQLPGVWHGLTAFGGWGDAGQHCRVEDEVEGMLERVRFFAEESDHLSGFQVLADDLSGWGQLTAQVLQEVRDEYGGNRPVMLYAVRPDAVPAGGGEADPAARRRRQLNQALCLSLLAPHCSTYTVVTPPTSPAALPLLRWQPASLYHASALCAAALDTATLAYRLAQAQGPDAPLGRTDMWGLSELLTGQRASPLAALSLSLPCPPPPADAQRQAQQADARSERGRGSSQADAGSSGGSSSSGGGPFTTRWLASLTPGVVAAGGDEGRFSEAVVLRGARVAGAALRVDAAATGLSAALAQEQHRCLQHCTLTAAPLPVPLPFPHIFARGLSRHGDAPPAGVALGSGGCQDVASCAVLTRHSGTSAFRGVVAAAQREFRVAAGAGQGQATLESWGYGQEELADIQERLTNLARAYDNDDI